MRGFSQKRFAGVLALLAFVTYVVTMGQIGQIVTPPAAGGVTPTGGMKSGPAIDPAFGVQSWSAIAGTPFVTVSYGPTATTGANFGSDTPGTTTNGIAEAVAYALALAAAVGYYATAQVLILGPQSYTISANIPVTAPAGAAQYYLGLRILGTGVDSQVIFAQGSGFTFSNYAWNVCEFMDIGLTLQNSGTATACVSAPSGINGNVSPIFFTNVQLQQNNTLNSGSVVNFPNLSGFYCYFANSTLATGINIVNGQDCYFVNCIIGGGSVTWKLACADAFFDNCNIGSAIAYNAVAGAGGTGQYISLRGTTLANITNAYLIDLSANGSSNWVIIRDLHGSATSLTELVHNTTEGRAINLVVEDVVIFGSGGSNVNCTLLDAGTLATGGKVSNFVMTGNATYTGVGAGIAALSLPTNPPVSGTVYQNPYGFSILVVLPVTYTPTAGTNATMTPAVGPSSSPTNQPQQQVPAGTALDSFVITYSLLVPAGWYYSFTVNANAALGTASVQRVN